MARRAPRKRKRTGVSPEPSARRAPRNKKQDRGVTGAVGLASSKEKKKDRGVTGAVGLASSGGRVFVGGDRHIYKSDPGCREHASPRPRLRCGTGDDRIEGKMIEKAGFPFRLC